MMPVDVIEAVIAAVADPPQFEAIRDEFRLRGCLSIPFLKYI